MKLEKLLYVTDIRQPSFSQIERLMDLRSFGLKEIIFLHATKLEGWEKRLADYGINSKTCMAEGPILAAISSVVDREAVSVIAAGLNRDKKSLLHGSLTRQLLRAPALPVLILPNEAASTLMESSILTHPIFATDWSAGAEKALGYLLNFKGGIKELEIVHVIDRRLSVRDTRNLKKKLTELRKTFLDHDIDAEFHIYAGKRHEEIMLAAENYYATCIVMGTTGKSVLKDLLSHPCARYVAEASAVPTLVVP